jgi:hypothetical protein
LFKDRCELDRYSQRSSSHLAGFNAKYFVRQNLVDRGHLGPPIGHSSECLFSVSDEYPACDMSSDYGGDATASDDAVDNGARSDQYVEQLLYTFAQIICSTDR